MTICYDYEWVVESRNTCIKILFSFDFHKIQKQDFYARNNMLRIQKIRMEKNIEAARTNTKVIQAIGC